MKAVKCLECNNETYQNDGVCVLCKIGITKIDAELADLLKKDNGWDLQEQKATLVK